MTIDTQSKKDERRFAAEQTVIRRSLGQLRAAAPELYEQIAYDPNIDILSSSHREDPRRPEATRWLMNKISEAQRTASKPVSQTLEDIQRQLRDAEQGKSGGIASGLRNFFQGNK